MSGPFIDRESNELDIEQIVAEAVPLLGLVVLFGSLALVPVLLSLLFPFNRLLSVGFLILAQVVLAVGTGIFLLYVVARGIQLAER